MNPLEHLSHGRRSIGLTLGILATAAMLSSVLYVSPTPPAHAQVDPCFHRVGTARVCRVVTGDWEKMAAQPASAANSEPRANLHELYHADGQKVGEIYVARAPGASTYVEHWVMFEAFEYPDVIKPAEAQPYASEQDFLAHVPFGPGYRYARWDVAEQSQIPGR